MISSTREIKYEDYNPHDDILYVHFQNDNGNSYGDEEEPGIEVMRDFDTDEVTGLMIFYPQARRAKREASLRKLGYSINLDQFACV